MWTEHWISKDWADHILTVLYEFWMNIWLMFRLVADSEFKVWAMFGRNRNGVLSVFNLCCKVKFSVRNYWDQFSPARLHLNTVQFMTQALCYWFLNPFSQTHSARTLFLLAWKYWKLCVRLELLFRKNLPMNLWGIFKIHCFTIMVFMLCLPVQSAVSAPPSV